MDWTKTTPRRDEKHISLGFGMPDIRGLVVSKTGCKYMIDIIYKQNDLITWFLQDLNRAATIETTTPISNHSFHEDIIKWKHFPRYWPFVRGIHRSPVHSPDKDQWRGAFMFSLICAWINCWVNNRKAGDLRRHCAHYDVTVMLISWLSSTRIMKCSRCVQCVELYNGTDGYLHVIPRSHGFWYIHKNKERHTAHTIVSWPNPKQWVEREIKFIGFFGGQRKSGSI